MKQDLETVRLELEDYLAQKPFVIFHGFSRLSADSPTAIEWDTFHHPDYKGFLSAAEKLNVAVIVLHTSRLTEERIDEALETMEEVELPYEERREFERRLKELRLYAGFTGEIEMSFDHGSHTYVFSRTTEWYEEAMSIMEEIDAGFMSGPEAEPGEDYGGYFSKN